MPRRYELKERARRQVETRRRIVEATVALHEELGPARTTIADIARRAGVGRVTVYNHFPDDAALIGACSAHWAAANPPPDPRAWAAIEDPRERLQTALQEMFAFYRANEAMLANVTRDTPLVPALAQVLEQAGAPAHERAARDIAAGPYSPALTGVALAFPTWQRLIRREGLTDDEAVALLLGAIAGSGTLAST
jgi:AcrR family transcriptional regulator